MEEGQGEVKTLATKRQKTNAFQKVAPLAERRRPSSLDEVVGQELVGEYGVLRSLIEQDRVPSMILWGGKSLLKREFLYLSLQHLFLLSLRRRMLTLR